MRGLRCAPARVPGGSGGKRRGASAARTTVVQRVLQPARAAAVRRRRCVGGATGLPAGPQAGGAGCGDCGQCGGVPAEAASAPQCTALHGCKLLGCCSAARGWSRVWLQPSNARVASGLTYLGENLHEPPPARHQLARVYEKKEDAESSPRRPPSLRPQPHTHRDGATARCRAPPRAAAAAAAAAATATAAAAALTRRCACRWASWSSWRRP